MSAPYSEGRSLKRLPQLLDVKINLPIATDVLKYDAVDENWVNGPAGGGGSATTVDVTDNDTNATFYPTYVSTDGVAQPLYCDKGATSGALVIRLKQINQPLLEIWRVIRDNLHRRLQLVLTQVKQHKGHKQLL